MDFSTVIRCTTTCTIDHSSGEGFRWRFASGSGSISSSRRRRAFSSSLKAFVSFASIPKGSLVFLRIQPGLVGRERDLKRFSNGKAEAGTHYAGNGYFDLIRQAG